MAVDAQEVEVLRKSERILIIQTAFPGDAILTLPMIQKLKKNDEGLAVDVLCNPLTEELFSTSPFVNETIVLDKRGKHRSILSLLKFVKKLREYKYNRIISPHRSFRSGLITLLLNIEQTYGFDNSTLKYAYNIPISYKQNAHEVQRNLALIGRSYGDGDWRILPELTIDSEKRKTVNDFLSTNQVDDFISIAPGSVWETKKYPIEYYSQIIEHFVKKGLQVTLIGSKEDKNLCEKLIIEAGSNVINAAGEFSLIESIELLSHSKLLICNDSAPTHLGMCADIPVLTIYCSTVPEIGFYPYNKKSSSVSYSDLECKPCGIHGHNQCPISTFDCGKLLLPSEVISEADKLLISSE